MSRFITRFADVVKIPESHLLSVNLNDTMFSCKQFMEGMCFFAPHVCRRMDEVQNLV